MACTQQARDFLMDPSMTLFTFLLRTDPSVNSVQLLGSWDNFSKGYKMERDSRRDRGQWRGCHAFQDILAAGGTVKRSGGLTMGSTYYYYYEVDGSWEIHDASKPSTNVCPSLPGQTVNTLDVPMEQAPRRLRSASMNSLRSADFKTMDPQDKFTTPRPTPAATLPFGPRIGTSPALQLRHKASSRSLSPAGGAGWTAKARRLLGLRPSSRSSDRVLTPEGIDCEDVAVPVSSMPMMEAEVVIPTSSAPRKEAEVVAPLSRGSTREGTRSVTPSEGSRSRDLSPQSLQRFLSDNKPTAPPPAPPLVNSTQRLTIPDDIVEENEDDDNFATSAVSESGHFTTLSPPPFQRSLTSPPTTGHKLSGSTATIVPDQNCTVNETFWRESIVDDESKRGSFNSFKLSVPDSYSAASSSVASPTSPQSLDSPSGNNFSFYDEMTPIDNTFSFFDDMQEGDDRMSPKYGQSLLSGHAKRAFTGYSLPQSTTDSQKDLSAERINSFGPPELVARAGDNGLPTEDNSFLSMKAMDAGLDDLSSELAWIARAI